MGMLISKLIGIYLLLGVVAAALLLLRDDRRDILRDLRRGFVPSIPVSILHVAIMAVVLPLTIPFTLGRIIDRWL